ncbi:MAG TPA: hypothetical protein VFQ79_04835 [Bryobacteraceae bacterium]|nr:hypothetical protein [Bryobacteraceae bacterium]
MIRDVAVLLALPFVHYGQSAHIIPGVPYDTMGAQNSGSTTVMPDGVLLVSGTTSDGRPFKHQTWLANQVKPQVTASVEPAGAGTVRYQYSLSNQAGARDGIRLFAVGMPQPDQLKNIGSPGSLSRERPFFSKLGRGGKIQLVGKNGSAAGIHR